MEFKGVTPVILGFLSFAPMSGYEIKQRVDSSTRFFWAASYGQIYPELRRLETAGLVESQSAPRGGRQRNVYTLTPAGREALLGWLRKPAVGHELRDEALLRLFFAGALEPEEALALVRATRKRHAERLAAIRAVEPTAATGTPTRLVLEFGLSVHEAALEWAERAEQRLIGEVAR